MINSAPQLTSASNHSRPAGGTVKASELMTYATKEMTRKVDKTGLIISLGALRDNEGQRVDDRVGLGEDSAQPATDPRIL